MSPGLTEMIRGQRKVQSNIKKSGKCESDVRRCRKTSAKVTKVAFGSKWENHTPKAQQNR